MIEWAKAHVMETAVSVAVAIFFVRFLTPNFVDLLLDIVSLGIIVAIARLKA